MKMKKLVPVALALTVATTAGAGAVGSRTSPRYCLPGIVTVQLRQQMIHKLCERFELSFCGQTGCPVLKPSTKPDETPVTKPDETPVTKPDGTPSTKPDETPVTKPDETPVTKPDETPVTKPDETPVTKPDETPATRPDETPSTKPDETPVTKPDETPVTRPDETPVTRPDETPVTKPDETPVTKPDETPVTKPDETPVTKPDETPSTKPGGSSTAQGDFASQVVALVNQQRANAGLSALKVDAKVQQAALVRAKEQAQSFSHTRPNGASCFTALTEAGVNYRGAGENIAYGQTTPQQVMNAWMNSEGHRKNIMNANFTTIGVGYTVINGTPYWAQLFTY